MSVVEKIQDAPGFVKDKSNKAVVNVSNRELEEYKKRRINKQKANQALNTMKEENAELKIMLQRMIKISLNVAELTNDELLEIIEKSKN